MKRGIDYAMGGLAAAIGGLAGVLGGWDAMLQTLLMFVAIDVITGYAQAIAGGTLSSAVSFRGSLRKLSMFAVIAVAVRLDQMTPGTGNLLRTGAILYYIGMEGVSIFENAQALGVPIPAGIARALEQVTRQAGEATPAPASERGEDNA